MEESVRGQPIVITAEDGYQLGATRYTAHNKARARLLVAGATGVPQQFYARFASTAASRGFEVLTFDYRGIGRSKPASLAGFEASYLDWARLDMRAAVDFWASDELPLFLVGHSFGAHALGLTPNQDRIAASALYGAGAGWHGWMAPAEQLRVRFMWTLVLPVIVRAKGYMAWSKLGMGEDLPRGVYEQWRRWCRFPRYFLDDPSVPELGAACARVQSPMLAVSADDDAWAPPSSCDAFMLNAYPHAPIERVNVSATELGPIGHVGYFRERARPLWERAFALFETQLR